MNVDEKLEERTHEFDWRVYASGAKVAVASVLLTVFVGCSGNSKGVKMDAANARETEIKEIVSKYISKKKGWGENDYRIVPSRGQDMEPTVIVMVVHKEDEMQAKPGGGKSLELYVDLEKKQVVRELGYQ
jgi:hypothetical protein